MFDVSRIVDVAYEGVDVARKIYIHGKNYVASMR